MADTTFKTVLPPLKAVDNGDGTYSAAVSIAAQCLGTLGASAWVIASDAPTKIKAFATVLQAGGYPVWVCDGTNDDVEIVAALAAAKDIKLSQGTLSVRMDQIVISTAGQALCGAGPGLTTINIPANGTKFINITEANVDVGGFYLNGAGHTVADVIYGGTANKNKVHIHDIWFNNFVVTATKALIGFTTGRDHIIEDIHANDCVTGTADNPCGIIKLAGCTNTLVRRVVGINSGHIQISNSSSFIYLENCDIDVDDNCHGAYYVLNSATDIFLDSCHGTVLRDKGHGAFEIRAARVSAVGCSAKLHTGDDGLQIQTENSVDVTGVSWTDFKVVGGRNPVQFYQLDGTGKIYYPTIKGLHATGYSNTSGQAVVNNTAAYVVSPIMRDNPSYVALQEIKALAAQVTDTLVTPIFMIPMWERAGNLTDYSRLGFAMTPHKVGAASSLYLFATPPTYLNKMTMAKFDGVSECIFKDDQASFSRDDTGGAGPFSWSAMVNLVASANVEVLFSKWNEATGSEAREYRISKDAANQILVEIYDETNDKVCSRLTDAAVATGSPIVLTIVYGGQGGATAANNIAIYVNGAVAASTATNDGAYVGMRNTTAELYHGAYKNAAGAEAGFYTGQMGWYMMTTAALTNVQAKQLAVILQGVAGV